MNWTLTEEHKAQIPAWNQKWIDITMSTAPMTADDRQIVADSIRGMYRAAKLNDDIRIVFVPSPLMAAVVAGSAAWWWYQQAQNSRETENNIKTDGGDDATYNATSGATDAATSAATYAATDAATSAATYAATDAATHTATSAATRAATSAATDGATNEAIRAATYAATDEATYAATDEATCDATVAATGWATYEATRDATDGATDGVTNATVYDAATYINSALSVVGDSQGARECIAKAWCMRNGGNQWASWTCFLSFVRDVVGWTHPAHEQYAHYEKCAIHSGPRYMHEKFCIVSDRPAVHKTEVINGTHRLHCEDGPALAWRDGWSLYYIHGVRVTEQIVMRPETITLDQIKTEDNEEVRRVMIERYGWLQYLSDTGAEVIDHRMNERDMQREVLVQANDGTRRIILTDPSTGRRYVLGVPRDIETCDQAQRYLSHGLDARAVCRT